MSTKTLTVARTLGAGLLTLVLALTLTLSGCTSTTPRGGDELPTPKIAPNEPDLQAERKAAGIADCPETDPNQAAVRGGLPALTLPCLGGGSEVHLAALRGPMVINFWANWCEPCRDEGPLLATAARSFDGRVKFLGIDTSDPRPGMAIEFAKSVGWTYPQLRDATGEHVKKPPLQANNLPLTIFVGADGRVVARHVGVFTTQAEVDEFITKNSGVKK